MKILILIVPLLLSSCIATTGMALFGIATTASDRRTLGTIADDKTLDLKLEAWAVSDKKLANTHLNFTVFNKNVLITGETNNADIKIYILQFVTDNYPVITRALDEIAIMPVSSFFSRTNDSFIDSQIEIALNQQEVVNPAHIKLHTENKVVYLMGNVTKREAEKAVKVAAKVQGVTKVVKFFNYLKSTPKAEIVAAKKREQEAKKRQIKEKQLRILEQKKANLNKQIEQLE